MMVGAWASCASSCQTARDVHRGGGQCINGWEVCLPLDRAGDKNHGGEESLVARVVAGSTGNYINKTSTMRDGVCGSWGLCWRPGVVAEMTNLGQVVKKTILPRRLGPSQRGAAREARLIQDIVLSG